VGKKTTFGGRVGGKVRFNPFHPIVSAKLGLFLLQAIAVAAEDMESGMTPE